MSHIDKIEENYAPYDSDEDVDTEEESDSEDIRIREQMDPRYAIRRMPTQFIDYNNKKDSIYDNHATWDSSTNIKSYKGHVYLDPPKTIKTSLVSIKSINRDKTVWPTPYRFQLKLPRVYKNVTKFQLVQLSFPNSNTKNLKYDELLTSTIVINLISSGVPSSCISDCISLIDCTGYTSGIGLIEKGRTLSNGDPLLVTLSVADGNYQYTNTMAQELTFKANSTPPFNIISYERFRDIFINTRDISVLFNEPGECFYSNIKNTRYGHHTKNDIMNVYYSQKHIDSFSEITEKIAFNAYYYPILKEAIATHRAKPFIHTGVFSYEEVVTKVMGIFEGLNSNDYFLLCSLNRPSLDNYRRHHTFEFRNINKYICSYEESVSKCSIIHDTLHPSLIKDFTIKYNNIMEQQLQLQNLNTNSYSQLKKSYMNYNSIYKHLETNLSTIIGHYHFVSKYKYNGTDYHTTSQSSFHYLNDLHQDTEFTNMFQYTSSFGSIYDNYNGTVMKFSTFLDYHSTLSSYYQIVLSTTNRISTINNTINDCYHYYISTKYTNILPQSMINNRTYTMNQGLPVQFITNQPLYIPGDYNNTLGSTINNNCKQICCSTVRNSIIKWYGSLPTNFVIQTTQYRLGLINILPNQFNFLSTIAQITSTGNLNFFLQINEEQGFSNMDVTMNENYAITNETTGQIKLMSGKILMGSIENDAGISQTVIQNPSLFDNGLGRLDKLDIKIYYDDPAITPAWLYQPYYLDIQEWNATFQIDEEVSFANRQTGWGHKPTIPISDNPDDTPYLFITHKDNPNNS